MQRMKKGILLMLVILLTGCTSVKESRTLDDKVQGDHAVSQNSMDQTYDHITGSAITDEDNNKESALINWKEAKIVEMGFYPRFAESTIVQNDRYIFYPEEGDKIMRIEKSSGESHCIFELKDVKKGTGAQICLAGNQLFIEYEGAIYQCSTDGTNVKKITDDTKKRFAAIIENCSIKDEAMIQGMKYYKGNLYLFTAYCSIVKLDLKNGEFSEIAKEVDSACFYGTEMYCADVYEQHIRKINLKTGKTTIVRGKKKTNRKQKEYYDSVMTVDNEIYYIYYKRGDVPSVYKYNKNGALSVPDYAEKLLEYYEKTYNPETKSGDLYYDGL